MSKESVVKELNEFLKGQYMGIHSYEHFIEKLEDPRIKKEFQNIQQDHKRHAQLIAERIQNLGGVPVDDEGWIGSVQGFFSSLTAPHTTKEIIQVVAEGEDKYGIHRSAEMVKGDLDPESLQLIQHILDHDKKHIDLLKSLESSV
ncbi:bacterioferritin [Paenibacillus shirakamiensis]|uniref:Bacterioferritin n=1 Tax=Paenibacillus shirakamiensis TaxID=1265935 RepID=A0ABS4JD53_9BACL|nr:ferritin-like domain-containing protein [Paenibacillus shirakamiensis]MBP1999641.1 bacterioferritin [Paenibacillus shirakamiensis]